MKRLALAAGLLALSACSAAPEPVSTAPSLASLGQRGFNPASGRAPQQIVVLFHGYTQRGDAMRPLAEALAERLPDAAIVFNNAPLRANAGFSWYDFRGDTAAASRKAAADGAAALITTLSNTYQVPPSRIVTVGFSQGAGVAVQAGTCVRPAIAAVVSLAGVVESACSREASGPDIAIYWNEGDPTVGRDRIDAGLKALDGAGYSAKLSVYQGMGHWPANAGIEAAIAFIVAKLGA